MAQNDLIIETFVAEELGDSAYLVGSRSHGEAALIDPQRDIAQYLERADALGVRITMALETHVHNDFVSGAREVAQALGATLGASAQADLEYLFHPLADGATLPLGQWRLRVVATPGHTPEHVSYLLTGEGGAPKAIFSGGSLMVGSIARPDLLGPAQTPQLARSAYQSLHERLLTLPDDVAVYPTHGGGSFCAVGASDERATNVGQERRSNPLAQAETYRQFLTRYLGNLGPYPTYYSRMRSGNRRSFPLLGRSLPTLRPLSVAEVETEVSQHNALIVDLRSSADYDAAHIPNSLYVGLDGAFSAWVGWVSPPETPIILIGASAEDEREAQRELLRIGYDNILGALEDGVAAWQATGRPLRTTSRATTKMLAEALERGDPLVILDSREADEWAVGHIPGAVLMPVAQIPMQAGRLPHETPIAVHCAHGYRSAIAASLLERAGLPHILHVTDGYEEWERLWR